MKLTKKQAWHKDVIKDFLESLNNSTDKYILKGGTALMLCYGLNRFSEDIDLDGSTDQIKDIVDRFCHDNGYNYRVAKDTPSVNRFMIHYNGKMDRPLKVEISYRKKDIDPETTTVINGIRVYKIDSICQQKAHAYESRSVIRDLNDVCFICNNYYDSLSANPINGLADAVSHRGLEHFDYIVKTQSDPLIDADVLAGDFLNMMDNLGLISDEVAPINREIVFPSRNVQIVDNKIYPGTDFIMAKIPDGPIYKDKDIGGFVICPKEIRRDGDNVTAIFADDQIKLLDKYGGIEIADVSDLKKAVVARIDEIGQEREVEISREKIVERSHEKDEDFEL